MSVIPAEFALIRAVKIPQVEQARMFQNLREAMEFQELKLTIERGVEPDERGMLPLRSVDD